MALNISSISSALLPNSAAQIASLTKAGGLDQLAALSGVTGLSSLDSGDSSAQDDFSIGSTAGLLSGLRSSQGAASPGAASLAAVGAAGSAGAAGKSDSFEQALLKAMDGVSASQNKSDDLLQKVVADPNSVDAQDVTIAMAEANMSLNLAKTILSRVVTAWKDVINTR